MAIDFPASPTLNDVFTVGNVTYVWDGTKWTASVTGGISLDKIEEGNTSAEVIDTGSDGRFVVTTEGTERVFVDANGYVGVGIGSPDGLLTLPAAASNTPKIRLQSAASDVDVAISSYGDANGTYAAFGANHYLNSSGNDASFDATKRSAYVFVDGRNSGAVTFGTNSSGTATERLRITSAGLVGIGTSSPGTLLELAGNGTAIVRTTNNNPGIGENALIGGYEFYKADASGSGAGVVGAVRMRSADSVGSSAYMTFSTALGGTANDVERVRITGVGRVGIGTTSPNSKLAVSNGGAESFEFYPADASNVNKINYYNRSGAVYCDAVQNAASHQFAIQGTERARIDSSGRLLVGTSTARGTFYNGTSNFPLAQIEGTSFATSGLSITRSDASASGAGVFLAKQRSGSNGGNALVAANDNFGTISFQGGDGTNLVEGAAIQAFVDSTPGANDMPGRLTFSTTADGASSPTERMRIDSAGNVTFRTGTTPDRNGSGTAFVDSSGSGSPVYLYFKKTFNGSRDAIDFNHNGTSVGVIQFTNTATSYATSSDYRLKENVTPVTDGITRLQQLKPARFNFIADPDKTVDGFLAHEVQDIVPEAITGEKDAVDEDNNPKYQGIDQSKLVPLLTAALQEAVAKIESLEGMVAVNNITIDEQQHQLSTLAARLTALESA
jgi:hypothetical protein